jgi:hypothetical protein
MARYNTTSDSTTINGATTISSPTQGAFINLTGTAPYTVTLPNPVSFPGSNQTFYNSTSGTVTLSTPGGNFVGTGASGTSTNTIFTGSVVSVTSDGSNYIVISEDGSPLIATTGSFSSDVTITGASATVNIQPSSLTLYPGATGAMDRVAIGVNNRSSGAFTSLAANAQVTVTANTASTSTGTGSLVVTGGLGVSGTVNASSVVATGLTGTIQTAAQANITSTGGLTVPTLILNPGTGIGVIRRSAVNGSNGVRIQGNAADGYPNDANAGAYIQLGGGTIGDTYEGNVDIVAFGGNVDANRNQIRFSNRSGTDTITERMRINKDGVVGIGTANPGANSYGATVSSYKLTILYDSPASNTVDDVVRIVSKFSSQNNAASATAGSGPAIVFAGGIGDNQTRDRARIVAVYEGGNVSGLAFHTQTNADTIAERVRIQNNGNVGIGSLSPANKLDVRGTLGIGTASSATDNAFTFSSVNNSANNHTHTFQGPSNGTNDDLTFNLSRGGGAYGSFTIAFIGSTRLFIAGSTLTNSGHTYIAPAANLGVGYTTPSEKLSVNGNITAGNTGHEYRVRGRNQPRLIYTVSPSGAMYSTQAFVWSTLFDTIQSTTSHFDSGMAYMLYLTSSNGVHAYSWKADLRVGGTAYGATSNRYRVSNMTEVLPPWPGGCGPSAFSAIDNSGFTYVFNPCYESVYISIIEYA